MILTQLEFLGNAYMNIQNHPVKSFVHKEILSQIKVYLIHKVLLLAHRPQEVNLDLIINFEKHFLE